MKNIEINTKAVKKLFAAGLLAFTMTGCGGNSEPTKEETPQGEIPQEETTEKIVGFEDTGKITYEVMSVEETKTLKEGQFIESENNLKTKVPDMKTLESLGLDYEVVWGSKTGKVGEELKESKDSYYYGIYSPEESVEMITEENGEEIRFIDYVKGVKIIPIIEVHMDADTPVKSVKLTEGETMQMPLYDASNYEILQNLNSVSYVYTKQK